MLGLLLFLFQTIQMLKLFQIKSERKKNPTPTKNESLPSPKKSNLSQLQK